MCHPATQPGQDPVHWYEERERGREGGRGEKGKKATEREGEEGRREEGKRSGRKRGGKKGGMEDMVGTVFAFKLVQANLVSLILGTWLRSTSKDDTSP